MKLLKWWKGYFLHTKPFVYNLGKDRNGVQSEGQWIHKIIFMKYHIEERFSDQTCLSFYG